ncbi:chemotaxis protein CheB [Alkaliflexus imshenetskii]|uniref:chemotaxis protein CheB n=1 Tax=Alkaliflexus imshenetskii TaxID=286730 RepID=UPI0004AFB7F6|nr:chemotaxis protein CheB [Alkaliflexus imshenetskii]
MISVKQNSHADLSDNVSESASGLFPIIGIGASAGGLEALEQFLENVPEQSGMAFVVIQHLDPTQKGMLPELLQRTSKMKVLQAQNRMMVLPDRVYVIPPNKSMTILKGMLFLSEPIEERGLRLPIDLFLRSLADYNRELAVGVILSGMGSDGSLGLRAIKAQNGIVMAQNPGSARFDSMPRSAIDSVLVDIVAEANELPLKLIDLMKHLPKVKIDPALELKNKSSLEKIVTLVRSCTGNDFSLYKKNTLYRRIERRMSVHKIDKVAGYVNLLNDNPGEVDILFKELLIGVTNFFRDSHVWSLVAEQVIGKLIFNRENGTVLRAWIPGCSTGEEAYSLAILFKEEIEKAKLHNSLTLQIFATDLDNEAIGIARKGLFPSNIAADVSPSRLKRFFSVTDDGYQMKPEIREMVVFAEHNLIMHPPFTKIDIVSCRNLLIYMDSELQRKVISLFHYSLVCNGYLILGTSETLGTQGHLFTVVDSKCKIFKHSEAILRPDLVDFSATFLHNKQFVSNKPMSVNPVLNIQSYANELLLDNFTPPGVLVNEDGDILYISGRTGKYLEPAVGKANMNIFAMLRDKLQTELPVAFRNAIKNRGLVFLRNIKMEANNGTQYINVSIKWIDKPEPLHGLLMIVFSDSSVVETVKRPSKKGISELESVRESELQNELLHMREVMQSTMEEMQTSQEELKSTNEELQSANEELQSTNEELTTSKEEMQSLNEELQTVNAELQSKVDEFSRVNNDMKNLLNSTDIATLFLDKNLNIRRYTNQATKIFKLIKSDIGRPITDLVTELIYPDMALDARRVLNTLFFTEKQIATHDRRWFLIRIMPYRTFDDRIDGLVMTFINTTEHMEIEGKLSHSEQMRSLLFYSYPGVVVSLSADGRIIELNAAAEAFLKIKSADVLDNNFFKLFVAENARAKAEDENARLVRDGKDNSTVIEIKKSDGSVENVKWRVHIIQNRLKESHAMLLMMQ